MDTYQHFAVTYITSTSSVKQPSSNVLISQLLKRTLWARVFPRGGQRASLGRRRLATDLDSKVKSSKMVDGRKTRNARSIHLKIDM